MSADLIRRARDTTGPDLIRELADALEAAEQDKARKDQRPPAATGNTLTEPHQLYTGGRSEQSGGHPTPSEEVEAQVFWTPAIDDPEKGMDVVSADYARDLARRLVHEQAIVDESAKLAARLLQRAELAEVALAEAQEQLRIAAETSEEEQSIAVQQQTRAEAAEAALAESNEVVLRMHSDNSTLTVALAEARKTAVDTILSYAGGYKREPEFAEALHRLAGFVKRDLDAAREAK